MNLKALVCALVVFGIFYFIPYWFKIYATVGIEIGNFGIYLNALHIMGLLLAILVYLVYAQVSQQTKLTVRKGKR